MVPSRLRSLFVVPLFSGIGCGALLGISPSDSQGEDEDGRGGSSPAGSGGTGAGGGAGESGAGSSGATTGGTGEAGSLSTGGSGGRGGNGGSTAGGSSGMGGGAGQMGGGAGEGGTDTSDFPQLHDPCSAWGALACHLDPKDPQPTTRRLECDHGTWELYDNCIDDGNRVERCDRRDGTCADLVCGADDRPGEPRPGLCGGGYVYVCGPDLVSDELKPCVFGCNELGDCRTAGLDQLVIDRPRSVIAGEKPWPERFIPVCWRESVLDNDALGEARRAVRLAVESLWSRESAVGFTGWGSCDASQARVELDFADDCKGELARIPRDGYPGGGAALPVTLCKSYYDYGFPPTRHPPMGTDTIELDLLGFVAQHVFGHVLGLKDVVEDAERGLYFMDPVLELTKFDELRPEPPLRQRLADWYGKAPGRSLVSPDGRCLSYESGVLSTSACNGSDAQAWLPRDDALTHDSGNCVSGPASEGALEIVECSAEPLEEKTWLPARVRIHNRVDYCLKAGTLPEDLALEWVNCDATWSTAEQRFRLGFVAPGRVRIHATHTTPDRCIVAPPEWTQPSRPAFGSCNDVLAVFEAFEGTLGQEGRCLTLTRTPQVVGLVEFEPCGTALNQQFYFSGPFERDGYALTFPMGGQPVELTSSSLGTIPTPEQIFDYRF